MKFTRTRISELQVFHLPDLLGTPASLGGEGTWREVLKSPTSWPTRKGRKLELCWKADAARAAWSQWLNPAIPLRLENQINDAFVETAIRGLIPLRLQVQARSGSIGVEAFITQFAVVVLRTQDVVSAGRALRDEVDATVVAVGSPAQQETRMGAAAEQVLDHLKLQTGLRPISKPFRIVTFLAAEADSFRWPLGYAEIGDLMYRATGGSNLPAPKMSPGVVGPPDPRGVPLRLDRRIDLNSFHYQSPAGLVIMNMALALDPIQALIPSLAWHHRYHCNRLIGVSLATVPILARGSASGSAFQRRLNDATRLLSSHLRASSVDRYGRHVHNLLRDIGVAEGLPRDPGRHREPDESYDLRIAVDLRTMPG